MEEKLIELKGDPCPYCGHDFCTAELYKMSKGTWSCSVCCPKCQTGGPFIPESEGVGIAEVKAIEAWNSLPRRLQWTKEKPTQEGWYWLKEEGRQAIVKMTAGGMISEPFVRHVNEVDGEWAGPLLAPMEAK